MKILAALILCATYVATPAHAFFGKSKSQIEYERIRDELQQQRVQEFKARRQVDAQQDSANTDSRQIIAEDHAKEWVASIPKMYTERKLSTGHPANLYKVTLTSSYEETKDCVRRAPNGSVLTRGVGSDGLGFEFTVNGYKYLVTDPAENSKVSFMTSSRMYMTGDNTAIVATFSHERLSTTTTRFHYCGVTSNDPHWQEDLKEVFIMDAATSSAPQLQFGMTTREVEATLGGPLTSLSSMDNYKRQTGRYIYLDSGNNFVKCDGFVKCIRIKESRVPRSGDRQLLQFENGKLTSATQRVFIQ